VALRLNGKSDPRSKLPILGGVSIRRNEISRFEPLNFKMRKLYIVNMAILRFMGRLPDKAGNGVPASLNGQ